MYLEVPLVEVPVRGGAEEVGEAPRRCRRAGPSPLDTHIPGRRPGSLRVLCHGDKAAGPSCSRSVE